MFKLALRSLIDKKLRFALTTFVVVLGVMFVVGSFTLTDGLRATFSGFAQDIARGADLTVRTDQTFGSDFDQATVPESVAERVLGVDGVDRIQPELAALNVFIVDADGEAIQPPGPPALGLSFNPGTLFITEGRQPARARRVRDRHLDRGRQRAARRRDLRDQRTHLRRTLRAGGPVQLRVPRLP